MKLFTAFGMQGQKYIAIITLQDRGDVRIRIVRDDGEDYGSWASIEQFKKWWRRGHEGPIGFVQLQVVPKSTGGA